MATGAASAPAVPITAADQARIDQALQDARASNTRRQYRSAWKGWAEWAGFQGHRALPADPAAAAYLAESHRAWRRGFHPPAEQLAQPSAQLTVTRAQPIPPPMMASAAFCRASPARPPDAGAARRRGLTADDCAAILATAAIPRRTGRGLESETAAADRGAVDKAIVSLLFQGGFRRSEAAALRWADVQDAADGRGIVVYVRRSKTDQDGSRGGRALPQERVCRDASPAPPPAHRAALRAAPGADRPAPLSRSQQPALGLVELQEEGDWQAPTMPAHYAPPPAPRTRRRRQAPLPGGPVAAAAQQAAVSASGRFGGVSEGRFASASGGLSAPVFPASAQNLAGCGGSIRRPRWLRSNASWSRWGGRPGRTAAVGHQPRRAIPRRAAARRSRQASRSTSLRSRSCRAASAKCSARCQSPALAAAWKSRSRCRGASWRLMGTVPVGRAAGPARCGILPASHPGRRLPAG